MVDPHPDYFWADPARLADSPRHVFVHDELRYAQRASQLDVVLDGFFNYHWLMSPQHLGRPKVMLEAGINAPAEVSGPDGVRRALIAIRSSPWKAGHETNPWHDEFDLDHGHVRYFGDHKPTTIGLPGATKGNRLLLEAARLHAGTTREERLLAPSILLFRSITVHRDGRALVKGHVEFCGAAIIERLEHVVQRDPDTGRSFPNIALDLAVVAGGEIDGLDLRWIDDRRNEDLDAETALRYAPASWRKWVERGRGAIPGVRRRVLASAVRTAKEQQPEPGSIEAEVLQQIYTYYDGRKHAFELLASRVAAEVLRESGARYKEGWLSPDHRRRRRGFHRPDRHGLAVGQYAGRGAGPGQVHPAGFVDLAGAGGPGRGAAAPWVDRRLRHHWFVLQAGPDRDHRRPVPGDPDLRRNTCGDGAADGAGELRRRHAGHARLHR